jgi:hypothetical protein
MNCESQDVTYSIFGPRTRLGGKQDLRGQTTSSAIQEVTDSSQIDCPHRSQSKMNFCLPLFKSKVV